MRTKPPDKKDINVKRMKDNQTWNDCPECGKDWMDPIPTPGLLHRTKLCDKCSFWLESNK